jgi:hypothetical protein
MGAVGFAVAAMADGRLTPVGGVLVLEVDALETALTASCFVGDFTGDRMPLVALLDGVGVPGTVLVRLPAASCCSVCRRAPFNVVCTLLTLDFTGPPLLGAFALGVGSSTTWLIPLARQKMPCFDGQSK